MVFTLRQIQEKYWEQNKSLYVMFIDLIKAFNIISGMILENLGELGCPPMFLTMVIQLHKNQLTEVRYNNNLSLPFTIKNGKK